MSVKQTVCYKAQWGMFTLISNKIVKLEVKFVMTGNLMPLKCTNSFIPNIIGVLDHYGDIPL